MADFSYETCQPLMSAVAAAGTALATAVANDDEALEAPGAALYAGRRPSRRQRRYSTTAVAALMAYLETLAPT